MKKLFNWLWNDVIIDDVVKNEINYFMYKKFDIYLYHQRKRNEKFNYEWNQTIIYSLSQQIIRIDFDYWMLYVNLRFDRNFKLVFYFYYIKYIKKNDNTFFSYIDINITRYFSNDYKNNIIQKSIFFDNETKNTCIVIMSNFYRYLKSW